MKKLNGTIPVCLWEHKQSITHLLGVFNLIAYIPAFFHWYRNIRKAKTNTFSIWPPPVISLSSIKISLWNQHQMDFSGLKIKDKKSQWLPWFFSISVPCTHFDRDSQKYLPWEGHILLPIVVETQEMTEKSKDHSNIHEREVHAYAPRG